MQTCVMCGERFDPDPTDDTPEAFWPEDCPEAFAGSRCVATTTEVVDAFERENGMETGSVDIVGDLQPPWREFARALPR